MRNLRKNIFSAIILLDLLKKIWYIIYMTKLREKVKRIIDNVAIRNHILEQLDIVEKRCVIWGDSEELRLCFEWESTPQRWRYWNFLYELGL